MSFRYKRKVETFWNHIRLRGILQKPQKAQTCVLLFHGFTGSKDEAYNHFSDLSNRLYDVGIASIRFDFGGHGESEGTFETMTQADWLAHLDAMVAFTQTFSFTYFIAIGFSMGGFLVLKRRHPIFNKIILINPAVNMSQIINDLQTRATLTRDGLWQINQLLMSQEMTESFTKDLSKEDIHCDRPTLVIQCLEDETVPEEKVRQIFSDRASVVFESFHCDHTLSSPSVFEEIALKITRFCLFTPQDLSD